MNIGLISCVKSKRKNVTCQAQDLYISTYLINLLDIVLKDMTRYSFFQLIMVYLNWMI